MQLVGKMKREEHTKQMRTKIETEINEFFLLLNKEDINSSIHVPKK